MYSRYRKPDRPASAVFVRPHGAASLFHQRDLRRNTHCFANLVRRKQDRRAALARVAQQVTQHGDGSVIERGEGLIEQQELRFGDECSRECESLPHAPRVLPNRYVGHACKIDAFQPIINMRPGMCVSGRRGKEAEVFPSTEILVDSDAMPQKSGDLAGVLTARLLARPR